jgi:tetratricopeptide (TPR) repeat protein
MDPAEVEQLLVDTWDFSDPSGSEALFHQLYAHVSPASPEAAVFLTQIARAHGLGRDFMAAHEALDTATGVGHALDVGPARDHAEARIAIERGRVVNSSGSPADAEPYFDVAHELAVRAGCEGLVIDALHMKAIVVGQTQGPEAAVGVNRRALQLSERSADPLAQRWRGSLLNNLGWDRHGAGDYAEALDLFERALAVRTEQGTPAQLSIARWSVARALRSLGRLDEALAIQRGLAADPANVDDGYIAEEVAECLLELGRIDEAKSWFSRAHILLSRDEWLVEHEPERLARLAEYTEAEADAEPGADM